MAMAMVASGRGEDRRFMGRHRRWSGRVRVAPKAPLAQARATLVPAPASAARQDLERLGLRIYRCAAPARLGGWELRQGADVLLSARSPEPGDLVAVATRSSLQLVVFSDGPQPEGRRIGVVEGVISEGQAGSKTTTPSTWEVWGNMSTGRANTGT